MPRMSDAEKQKSHKRILDAASQLFRERGIEATSVSDVMKAAGLTHGGFYRHFDSKEALVTAAFKAAVDDVLTNVETAPPGPQHRAARSDYIARYLSEEHIEDRSRGCPLAALGAEISRQDGPVNDAAWNAIERMAQALEADDPPGRDRGHVTMALLLGTVTLARLAGSRAEAHAILDAGKQAENLLEQHWPR
ncbi:TetR/AcrR family transcriptional regulator [Sulfitobacter sp. JB4-11]|uniref:TetR/AcrR family transcriptional regulator n=1 Tax=Sulfitobacter rhodophyticola TaxID=3238304 RepID=UPI003D818387